MPIQFQLLFLDHNSFASVNQLAAISGNVPDVCDCTQCEALHQAVADVQKWLAAIKDEEEKKDDYSEFYFMASKLSKTLPVTLNDDFFRRIFINTVPNPCYHNVKDIPVPLLEQMNKRCVICAKGFKESGQLFLFPSCQHVFHIKCTEAWLSTRQTCPMCRHPYS